MNLEERMNINLFLSKSGIWGYPLLFLSILSLAIIIERIIFYIYLYHRDRKVNINKYEKKLEKKQNLAGVEENDYFNEMLKNNFENYSYFSYTKVKISLEKLWEKAKKNMNILEFTVKVAPLLGILGTISGIIKSFIAVGEFSLKKKALVTSGISEALLTTAAGLIISIFVMFWLYIFKWFRKRIFTKYEDFMTVFEAILNDGK